MKGNRMAKVAIIYYSATGTVYHLARAVAHGASGAGAEVRFRKVRELAPEEAIASNQGWVAHRLESQHVKEATNDDLVWADAIIFGTPTRYGLPFVEVGKLLDAGTLKAFVSAVVPLEDAAAVYRRQIQQKDSYGKVVIAVPA
jgi:multimeric flavodoxin WrbA